MQGSYLTKVNHVRVLFHQMRLHQLLNGFGFSLIICGNGIKLFTLYIFSW